MAKRVKDYWPADFERDMKRTLEWLYGQGNAPGQWQANALPTVSASKMWQCGIVSAKKFPEFAQAVIENIVFNLPTDVLPDWESKGPDGFAINYGFGGSTTNTFTLTEAMTVEGDCYSLIDELDQYRVDIFAGTDAWYYKGSTSLVDAGGNVATWSKAISYGGTPAALLAVLYPTYVAQPDPGWYGTMIPAGWRAHTNMGVGKKLVDYNGRVYSKTDIEYLKESDLPIIVQDWHHARVGSTRLMGSGAPTVHIMYDDPFAGWISVFSSLQHLAVLKDLPRSLEVPTSDPFFIPDVTITNSAAVRNRCWIYDAALALIVYAYSGNHAMAQRMLAALNGFLDEREYLAQSTLENAEDGSTARWTKSNPDSSMTTWNDPLRTPFGAGKQLKLTSVGIGDQFTYAGPAIYGNGVPSSADYIIQWQFRAHSLMTWYFEVALSTAGNNVQKLKVTSDPEAPPTYDSGTKTITYPIGPGNDDYHFHKFNLQDLCANLASDTWVSTDGFKVVLTMIGDLHLDNLTVGQLQPEGSLSFSFDVYYGLPDSVYIRTGAMAWVSYAYAMYMELTADYTPALYLQKMLNFLLTLESTDQDLRNGLFKGGYGSYQNPGYHYVPGAKQWCSTEHNIDVYFAFVRASKVLPTAATELLKRGWITGDQATSLRQTASAVQTKAINVANKLLTNVYIPPGADPGHFAQGVQETGSLDTAVALDAAGSWAAMFCHAVGDDIKATECLKFIYQKLFLTNQTIAKSNESETWNMAWEQLRPFDGFTVYGAGYESPPQAVWQEGTWGVIDALLRCQDVPGVQSYFASVEGSLDSFLGKLIRGQKTVWTTTGNGSLLMFSRAARSLPYEFSVWGGISSAAWMWLTAMAPLGLSEEMEWELWPYLKVPKGVEQHVEQLEGRGSIGALELEATDGSGFMTALASGGKLEGRKVTLQVGYPELDTADFVTVITQEVESVEVLEDYTGFRLQCRDLKRSAKSKVFLKGDDGLAISQDHPRKLSANPIDVALIIFQNELGFGQTPGLPSSAWNLYDPAWWLGDLNPTLINPNPYLDLDKFIFYRNGIFAGYFFDFEFQQPVEAKQFLEHEIFKVLGGYLVVLADGRLSPRFFVPPYSITNPYVFSELNMTILPRVERHPIINQVSWRMDYDGSKFRTELLFVHAPSMQQFGLAGQHIVESKGMSLARGGASLAGLTANRIFQRYGGIDPLSGQATGGAAILSVSSQYLTLGVEVGDFVFLSHALLPNFLTGQRGVISRIFEVIEKQPNFSEGTMQYKLLDTNWVGTKKLSKVAPDGTPAWPGASQTEKDKYMFICDETTKQYSDGTAGKTIW